MKKIILISIVSLVCVQLLAQVQKSPKVFLQLRGDYTYDVVDGEKQPASTGFDGKIAYFRINGNLNEKISYDYRQRINKMVFKDNLFHSIDYMLLKYRASESWGFAAGKSALYAGGFEFDYSPVDIHFSSEYLNYVGAYGFGVSVEHYFNEGKDNLIFQFCESPYRSYSDYRDIYGYNLIWYGNRDSFQTIYSINAHEYARGKFLGQIAIGNKFLLGDKCTLSMDWIQRSGLKDVEWKCFSTVFEMRYNPSEKWSVVSKYFHDHNSNYESHDTIIAPGTRLNKVGGIVEWFPLSNKDLRLHAYGNYAFGKMTASPAIGAMEISDKYSLGLGLTWVIGILN